MLLRRLRGLLVCTVYYLELPKSREKSCISGKKAFYRNLQVANLEKLAKNIWVGISCHINLKIVFHVTRGRKTLQTYGFPIQTYKHFMGKLRNLNSNAESKFFQVKSLVSTHSACPRKNYVPKYFQTPHELDYLFNYRIVGNFRGY